MHSPVHHCLSWLAVTAVTLSSFFIFSAVLAQTETLSDPFGQVYAPDPAPTAPLPPLPDGGQGSSSAPLSGGEPLPPQPFAGEPGQPQPYPGPKPPYPARDGQMPSFSPDGPQANFEPEKTCPPGMVCSSRRFEDDRLRMDKERMAGMKRGMGQFVSGMTMVRKQVDRLVKKGLTPPAELTAALAKVSDIKVKIEAATTPEELEELPKLVDEVVQVVEEWMPKLPRIVELPRVVKQADRELTKLERAYKLDERKAKVKKLDLAENLKEFRAEIDKAKTTLAEVKNLIKAEPDKAFEKLDEDFFANLDNVWEKEKIIQVALNMKAGITRIAREIKSNEKIIAGLKKKKVDTAELEADLAAIKESYEEVKKIYNTKPVDADLLVDTVEELFDLAQELKDKIHDLTGKDEYEPKLLGEMKQLDFQMPSAFKFEKPKPEPVAPVAE